MTWMRGSSVGATKDLGLSGYFIKLSMRHAAPYDDRLLTGCEVVHEISMGTQLGTLVTINLEQRTKAFSAIPTLGLRRRP